MRQIKMHDHNAISPMGIQSQNGPHKCVPVAPNDKSRVKDGNKLEDKIEGKDKCRLVLKLF